MENTEATKGTKMTIKQSNGTVELVKKCVVCGATLLVETWESQKDRHAMCGYKYDDELRLQHEMRETIRQMLAATDQQRLEALRIAAGPARR